MLEFEILNWKKGVCGFSANRKHIQNTGELSYPPAQNRHTHSYQTSHWTLCHFLLKSEGLSLKSHLKSDLSTVFLSGPALMLTCPSIGESRYMQLISVTLSVDGKRGVTSEHFFSVKVLHVDQQLVISLACQLVDVLKTCTHTHILYVIQKNILSH